MGIKMKKFPLGPYTKMKQVESQAVEKFISLHLIEDEYPDRLFFERIIAKSENLLKLAIYWKKRAQNSESSLAYMVAIESFEALTCFISVQEPWLQRS